jgi:acylphosphatase
MIVRMSQYDANDIQELHAWVSGWVQGVGFRYFVIDNAQTLGLRGYVRNAGNGDVEVVAQGPRSMLERLVALLRRGPSAAHVTEVRVNWGKPTEHFSGFNIRW